MEFQRVLQMFDTLPSQAKQEVIDFIEFLQSRYSRQKTRTSRPPKKSKLTEEAFVGMWENHDDIEDLKKAIQR